MHERRTMDLEGVHVEGIEPAVAGRCMTDAFPVATPRASSGTRGPRLAPRSYNVSARTSRRRSASMACAGSSLRISTRASPPGP